LEKKRVGRGEEMWKRSGKRKEIKNKVKRN
jgi:hypothetical protein